MNDYVETELGELFVRDVGQGETVVVLWPAIFTDHAIYEGLVERLSESYRFLLVDGFGHGRSTGPKREFSMTESSKALATVLDHFELPSAILGGTSWGGLVSAELALRKAHKVQALLLMNTPMDIDQKRPDVSARLIAFGARWALGSRFFRKGVERSFFSTDVLDDNPNYRQKFHQMLQGADRLQLSAAVRSVMLQGQPLRDRLADISVPTLIVAGELDKMYPLERQASAARHLPHGSFQVVGGKHISAVERPDDVAAVLSRFISST